MRNTFCACARARRSGSHTPPLSPSPTRHEDPEAVSCDEDEYDCEGDGGPLDYEAEDAYSLFISVSDTQRKYMPTDPTNIAGVNLVMGCCKVFFFFLPLF